MRIDRLHPAQLRGEQLDVAVVIDVLRATSTAVALSGRGVRRLLVFGDPSGLESLPPAETAYLLFSELSLPEARHEQVDNSPAVASRIDLAGRTPILVTTNGTKAIRAALLVAKRVFLATFSNLRAAAEVARSCATDRVTALPAGSFDAVETRTEDEACAKALISLLDGTSCDIEAVAAACFEDDRVRRRMARRPEFREDAEWSLTVDSHRVVPSASLLTKPSHDLIEVCPTAAPVDGEVA